MDQCFAISVLGEEAAISKLSGRLVPVKGAHLAIEVAKELASP